VESKKGKTLGLESGKGESGLFARADLGQLLGGSGWFWVSHVALPDGDTWRAQKIEQNLVLRRLELTTCWLAKLQLTS